jgi:hypothetical protein
MVAYLKPFISSFGKFTFKTDFLPFATANSTAFLILSPSLSTYSATDSESFMLLIATDGIPYKKASFAAPNVPE